MELDPLQQQHWRKPSSSILRAGGGNPIQPERPVERVGGWPWLLAATSTAATTSLTHPVPAHPHLPGPPTLINPCMHAHRPSSNFTSMQEGREEAPMGALDVLRVASALEDFLRMLGLHEQLQVIRSSSLLGACKGSPSAGGEGEQSLAEGGEHSSSVTSPGRQLHVQRVLPSGRSVALSVS